MFERSLALLVVGVAVTARARADDQSYVRFFDDIEIAVGVNSPAIELQAGRMV